MEAKRKSILIIFQVSERHVEHNLACQQQTGGLKGACNVS